MARGDEREFSSNGDRELLEVLAQLHHRLLEVLPYDVDAKEAWFDAAARLLADAHTASQRLDWLMMLAWAYKRNLGQGLPVSMIIGRLLNTRGTSRFVLLPIVYLLGGLMC